MDLLEVYSLVVDAAKKGVDVNGVVPLLNQALNATGATRDAILQEAIQAVQNAEARHFWTSIQSLAVAAAAAVLIALFALNYKKVIGFLFLKIYGKRKVLKGAGKPKTLLFDSEVAAIVVAVAVVATAFATAVQFRPQQPFTAIGILGPQGKIGGYPDNVAPGTNVSLYIYVYNHMGTPIWFRVVGRYTPSPNVTASPNGFYIREFFLPNNGSILLPVSFKVNSTGVFKAELWMYETNGTLVYTNETAYIWIHVKPNK
ncbi:MAG: DUF1616 domain-containing protein [Pyrobaculum sp.]